MYIRRHRDGINSPAPIRRPMRGSVLNALSPIRIHRLVQVPSASPQRSGRVIGLVQLSRVESSVRKSATRPRVFVPYAVTTRQWSTSDSHFLTLHFRKVTRKVSETGVLFFKKSKAPPPFFLIGWLRRREQSLSDRNTLALWASCTTNSRSCCRRIKSNELS
jgi:hypothetical protein